VNDFLLENDELPEEDWRTLMQIDIRRKGEDGSIGYHVTAGLLHRIKVL
jgi:hypothetical protein